jgi:hypothetical protein
VGTEYNGTQERQLEKLRRDFGDVFLTALADPETVEILLNPDGTLWQERLGAAPMQIGSLSPTKAEAAPHNRSLPSDDNHTGKTDNRV